MDYITIAGLEERIGSTIIANLARVTGAAYTTLLTNVINRAEDTVDAYAQKLYHVPLPVSNIVVEWVYTIAEFEMYKRGPGNNIPDKFIQSLKKTMDELKDMQKGDLYPEGALQRKNTQGLSLDIDSDDSFFDQDNFRRF